MLTRLLVVLVVAAAACGGSATGPTGALERYSRALRDKEFDQAYELMSASFRAQVSRDEFVALLADNPKETAETAERFGGGSRAVRVSAELEFGLGEVMRLVVEGGEWRIATHPLAFYDQSTPRDALRSFLRAYRLGRWEVMLRFVPEAYRAKMSTGSLREQFTGANEAEMKTLMDTLEANLAAPIVEKGNEARMAYAERYEVKFVREDGAWRIQDFD